MGGDTVTEAIKVGSTLLVAAGAPELVGGGDVAVGTVGVIVGAGGGVLVGGSVVGSGVALATGSTALVGLGKLGVKFGTHRDCPGDMAFEVRQFAYLS